MNTQIQEKQQLRSRFFGQHIGCRVNVFGMAEYVNGGVTWDDDGVFKFFDGHEYHPFDNNCKLILRPLSSITDEEVFEMFVFAGFFGIDIIRDTDKIGVIGRNGDCAVIWIKISPKPIGRFLEAWNNVKNKEQPEVFEYMIVDWLRSKNFALPFCGIDPVSEGWAILEEK